MNDRDSEKVQRFVPNSDGKERFGYQPQGQRGYQPQSNQPIDPMKLTPPKGGSAVQPPPQQTAQSPVASATPLTAPTTSTSKNSTA